MKTIKIFLSLSVVLALFFVIATPSTTLFPALTSFKNSILGIDVEQNTQIINLPSLKKEQSPVFSIVTSKDSAAKLGSELNFGMLQLLGSSEAVYQGKTYNTTEGETFKLFAINGLENSFVGLSEKKVILLPPTLSNTEKTLLPTPTTVVGNLQFFSESSCYNKINLGDSIKKCSGIIFSSPYSLNYQSKDNELQAIVTSTNSEAWKSKGVYNVSAELVYQTKNDNVDLNIANNVQPASFGSLIGSERTAYNYVTSSAITPKI